jgi:hypothetical protein
MFTPRVEISTLKGERGGVKAYIKATSLGTPQGHLYMYLGATLLSLAVAYVCM